MNKRALIAIPVIVAVLAGGYLIDRAREEKRSVLSGTFESQPTIASSRIGGRVVEILVSEGDTVRTGQALVRLEDKSYAATSEAQQKAVEQAEQQYLATTRGARVEEISRAQSAVDEAQANLRRLVAGSRPEEIASARAAENAALARLKAAQRGLTPEERAQLRARADAAAADEALARKQFDRMEFLYGQGAVAKQQYDTALAAYQQAQARHRDADEGLRRAQKGTPKEELAQAREGYRQAAAQRQLVQRGAPREEIDAARARLNQAESALAELQHGNRPEDIAKARAAHEQAQLQAQSISENLKEQVIYSPGEMAVDRIVVSAGDLVQPGSPIAQLSDPNDLWLRVYLPENELAKVKQRDRADLRVDGVSGTVQAVVESIATHGEFTPANLQSPEERGKQVFGIRLRLAGPDRRVKPGMAATVVRMGQWP